MQTQADKPMRRLLSPDSEWETIDPASGYSQFHTSRRGEFNENIFAFTRIDVSEVGLPDAIHLFVGTQNGTSLLEDGVGVIYDFRTDRNVSDALANVSKYADFYSLLNVLGYSPTHAIAIEAVSQAQAMVNAALAE